jgi:hypothetical protein
MIGPEDLLWFILPYLTVALAVWDLCHKVIMRIGGQGRLDIMIEYHG